MEIKFKFRINAVACENRIFTSSFWILTSSCLVGNFPYFRDLWLVTVKEAGGVYSVQWNISFGLDLLCKNEPVSICVQFSFVFWWKFRFTILLFAEKSALENEIRRGSHSQLVMNFGDDMQRLVIAFLFRYYVGKWGRIFVGKLCSKSHFKTILINGTEKIKKKEINAFLNSQSVKTNKVTFE